MVSIKRVSLLVLLIMSGSSIYSETMLKKALCESGNTLAHWIPSLLIWRYEFPKLKKDGPIATFIYESLYSEPAVKGSCLDGSRNIVRTPHLMFIPVQAIITGASSVFIHRILAHNTNYSFEPNDLPNFVEGFIGELAQKLLNRYCNNGDGACLIYNVRNVALHLALSKVARYAAIQHNTNNTID